MSANNLTASNVSLSSSTPSNNGLTENNWKTRLQEHWLPLASSALCMALCLLVMGITMFCKKRITGGYKWFILNQALSNFLCAFGSMLFYSVIYVYFGLPQFASLYLGGNTPIWLTVFVEIILQEIQIKFGEYAQYTTLLATVFNRWVAVALPSYYSAIMTPRLIFLYCSLCYLLLLPIDVRLFKFLSFSKSLTTYFTIVPFTLPWLLCIILSLLIVFTFWKHIRMTENILDKYTLQENRYILYSLMIQIAVPLLDKVPRYVVLILRGFGIISEQPASDGWFITYLGKIGAFNSYFSNAYTCLVILFTVPPYRRALLSLLLSSAAKFSECYSKLKLRQTRITPIQSERPSRIVRLRSQVS